MDAVAALDVKVERLLANLPALVRLSANAELRRERDLFEKKRKEGISRKSAKM